MLLRQNKAFWMHVHFWNNGSIVDIGENWATLCAMECSESISFTRLVSMPSLRTFEDLYVEIFGFTPGLSLSTRL